MNTHSVDDLGLAGKDNSRWRRWIPVFIFIFLLVILFLNSFALSQAASHSNVAFLQATDETETPTATTTTTPTLTATPGDSFFPFVSKGQLTPTPTGTLISPTPTFTGTPFTPTPTMTGTPPTPTSTGAAPIMAVSKTAVITQATVGQNLTFTLRVTNSGNGPAYNVTLTDNFQSFTYLDIFNLATTRGTISTSGRIANVNIGTVNPGEAINITLVVRVNSTAPALSNPCNTASISFLRANQTQSQLSNQVCYRVVGSSTLPPTGENPLEFQSTIPDWPRLWRGIGFGFLGFLLLAISLWARLRQKIHTSIPTWIGVGMLFIGILSSLTAAGWLSFSEQDSQTLVTFPGEPIQPVEQTAQPSATPHPLERLPAYLFATPHVTPEPLATLPDYPIPSPSIPPAQADSRPDTSAVVRLIIPSLSVDAEVKYVPFDGNSWLISGLRQEVAWLGDTSWPGLGGNTGLAGHITVRGEGDGPFRHLDRLEPGAEVKLYTERNIYTYHVREQAVVDETDLSVLEQDGENQLTLVTCTEWNDDIKLYLKRFIVYADLDKVEPAFPLSGN